MKEQLNQESKRYTETMCFFNMLNEPERSEAIENYDERYSELIPYNTYDAIRYGFDWEDTFQGYNFWDKIYDNIKDGTYNFKTEHMEQQTELDYQISVMQAFKEGRKIEVSFKGAECWLLTINPEWNWEQLDYRVKPEPPQPKTVPFSFEDAEFLLGKKIRNLENKTYSIICHVIGNRFCDGIGSLKELNNNHWEYQDPETKEWKPFVKTIE